MHLRHQWSSSSSLLRPQSEPGEPLLAYGLSTPEPPNRASPPSVSPKIPTPHFHQISLPSALSTHRQDDPVECNGVGEDHAQYSATRNSMKRRAADGKLLSARVIHENESGPTPTKPTPPRFICALRVPEPKLTDTWISMGYPPVDCGLGLSSVYWIIYNTLIFKFI